MLNPLYIYADTVEEAVEEVEYALGDMKSNFTSALMDMSNTAETFSGNISKVMAQNFIENFVLGQKFDQQMEYWQGQYERIIGGGYSYTERKKQLRQLRDTIAAAKEGYVEEALAIQELLGIGTNAEDKSASVSAVEKITYDQADEMTGILRAIQIAGEQRNDILILGWRLHPHPRPLRLPQRQLQVEPSGKLIFSCHCCHLTTTCS